MDDGEGGKIAEVVEEVKEDRLIPVEPTPVELWLAALRSGKYTQAVGYLRTDDGFCCLGVACDLYMKETGQGEWAEWTGNSEANHQKFVLPEDTKELDLPNPVMEWLGLASITGEFTAIADTDEGEMDYETNLAEKNDGGMSFAQIADIIESRPEGLFTT